jgi:hypothetical protein
LQPCWNWVSLPLCPVHPDPDEVFGFDVGGKLWRFDRYSKSKLVYRPPFVTFDLNAGEGYLLWLETAPQPVSYRGFDPPPAFETKLGGRGWSWVGLPATQEMAGPEFMQNIRVRYPSSESGEIRTAAEDRLASDPWVSWGWVYWDAQRQAARAFTPYLPFGQTVCRPWVGYWVFTQVGTAQTPDDPDQVTLIWP